MADHAKDLRAFAEKWAEGQNNTEVIYGMFRTEGPEDARVTVEYTLTVPMLLEAARIIESAERTEALPAETLGDVARVLRPLAAAGITRESLDFVAGRIEWPSAEAPRG